MKVSLLIPCCNQADELRLTLASAREAMGDLNHEIIVVDDHSIDGSCHGLPKDVLVIRSRRRDGCSASRQKLFKASTGDALIWSDPHCRYPAGSFPILAEKAMAQKAIFQPYFTPGDKSRRRSGRFEISGAPNFRGLRIARAYRGHKPPTYHALFGTVYAVQRKLYEWLGGFPVLPGVWGSSEQALSLMCWFTKTRIVPVEELEVVHKLFHKFPYHVNMLDPLKNTIFVHGAFFPRSFDCFWKDQIFQNRHYRGRTRYLDVLKERGFRRYARFVEKRRRRSEEQFFRAALGMDPPAGMKDAPIAQPKDEEQYRQEQERRSPGKEMTSVRARVNRALHWAASQLDGAMTGRALDLGSRDGYALLELERLGVQAAEGIEFSRRSQGYAASQGRKVRLGDMRKLDYADGAFDLVTAIHSLEHCLGADRALAEAFRVLRPGGWLFIVVPQEGTTKDAAHVNVFPDHESLRRLVVSSGAVVSDSVRETVMPLRHGLLEMMLLVQKEK